jgi:hypothetical protein
MKQLFLEFYYALKANEKGIFWLGVGTLSIGFFMLIDNLKPPEWFGWQETKGDIIGVEKMDNGRFSGGGATFLIRYNTLDGQVIDGSFKSSPLVLRTRSNLKVYYKTHKVTNFYVYTSSKLIIALTAFIFGMCLVLSFIWYYRDKKRGINYN